MTIKKINFQTIAKIINDSIEELIMGYVNVVTKTILNKQNYLI